MKLSMAVNGSNRPADKDDPTAATMRTMNMTMPLFSLVMVFTLPTGIGIYWIVGAVIRCVQQIVINNYMNKIDMEDLVRHNQEKVKKKLEKKGVDPQKINQQARMNVRNIQEPQTKTGSSVADKAANVKKSTDYYKNANTSYKPGSLAAKANMVRQFDEKNGKKK